MHLYVEYIKYFHLVLHLQFDSILNLNRFHIVDNFFYLVLTFTLKFLYVSI